MGGALFGSSPKAAKPFRGPGHQQQGELLDLIGRELLVEAFPGAGPLLDQQQAQLQQHQQIQLDKDALRKNEDLRKLYDLAGGKTRLTQQDFMNKGTNAQIHTILKRNPEFKDAFATSGKFKGSLDLLQLPGFTQPGQLQPGQQGQQQGPGGITVGGSGLQAFTAEGQGPITGQGGQFARQPGVGTQFPFTPGQQFDLGLPDFNLAQTTQAGPLGFGATTGAQATQFDTPQFSQRNPFQFTGQFDAKQAVGDAFTPFADRIQSVLGRQGELQDAALAEDLNRRGLTTSGASTEALGRQREIRGDQLSNALLGLAGQQAQQQLGAEQFGFQAEQQRQLNQASEIFRQQGATDQQAQFLAQNALQQDAARRAQEQQRFGQLAGLEQLGLAQQQQAFQQAAQAQQQGFGQQLAQRGQGLAELGLARQLESQPFDRLLQLYQLSTGGTPGTPGQAGLLGSLGGAAAGAFLGPAGSALGRAGGNVFGDLFK